MTSPLLLSGIGSGDGSGGGANPLPPGGTTHQVLRKEDETDFLVEWGTPYGEDDVRAVLATQNIDDLGDVSVGTPAANNVLIWNATAGQWQAAALPVAKPSPFWIPASAFDRIGGAPVFKQDVTNVGPPLWALLSGDIITGTFLPQWAKTKLTLYHSQNAPRVNEWTFQAQIGSQVANLSDSDVFAGGAVSVPFAGVARKVATYVINGTGSVTTPLVPHALRLARAGSFDEEVYILGVLAEEGT